MNGPVSNGIAALLDGVWQPVRLEFGGEIAPEVVLQKTELEFSNGTYQVRFDGIVTDRGRFQLNAARKPAVVVLLGVEGQNAGREIPAIFQRVGERLRVCYGMDGVEPATFNSTAGTKLFLATYRRV
jgi:uncharacterized protein (TIGR03067 family)